MDRYVLPPAKRLVVRLLGVVFFVMALFQVADAPIPLVAPHLTAPAWHSAEGLIGEPEALLPYKARERVETDAGVKARFLAHLAEPTVRVRHLLLTLAIDGPVFLILFGMAMALWRSTRLVPDAVEQGLWWLMTVGWATVICALTYPILDGMRTVVLLSGVIPTPSLIWYDPATGGMTYIMLLIAAGILAATWTISAGLKARRDMAEFV